MAIVAAKSNIIHKRGDAYVLQYRIYDYDPDTEIETEIDITNFKIDMQIRSTDDSPDVLITPTLEKTNATKGVFIWRITPQISESILVGQGVYDIQITIPNDNPSLVQIVTFLEGSFTCVNDVTRPLSSYNLPPLALRSYAYGATTQLVAQEPPMSPLEIALSKL